MVRAQAIRGRHGFTVVELLVVMAVIVILAALILSTSGYVQKKGARSRAEAEIAAMSAALESYKADNGIYPTSDDTKNLDPSATNADYKPASRYLYTALTGDDDDDSTTSPPATSKNYFPSLRSNMLGPTPAGPGTFMRDPFGNSYGYSTMNASGGTNGYNPTFDLWSTASDTNQASWIKNW